MERAAEVRRLRAETKMYDGFDTKIPRYNCLPEDLTAVGKHHRAGEGRSKHRRDSTRRPGKGKREVM